LCSFFAIVVMLMLTCERWVARCRIGDVQKTADALLWPIAATTHRLAYNTDRMKVLKFGGSSLGSPARVADVGRIVLDARRGEPIIVVVSAFQGVTDQLFECARLAERGDAACEAILKDLAKRHQTAVTRVVVRHRARVASAVEALLDELRDTVHGIRLLRHCPDQALDTTASFGERLSALIVAAHLQESHPAISVDSRQLVITDDRFTHAAVNFSKTNRAMRAYFAKLGRRRSAATRRSSQSMQGLGVIPVVTGFIGATEDGRTTTIGRNGSDYSAAIVGAALGASVIEIWTDVDGVLSADPKLVAAAFPLPHVSYEEAMELSYFGAKVLHSATIAPAVAKRIPIVIKNTLNPEAPGTRISSQRHDDGALIAKGISSVDGISLLTLRGTSMVGVPGTAERLFRTLAGRGVNVILISQASSEHTICFAVRRIDVAKAIDTIEQEFRFELGEHRTRLDHAPDQAIVAVVGDGMKGRPGVSGKLFSALGRHNINISAIAQGASERNISCVIDADQQVRALNVIHQAFFEKRRRLALAVVGVGNIGSALLRQLHQQRAYLLSKGFEVVVVALANSSRFVVAESGISLAHWQDALRASRRRMTPAALLSALAGLRLTHAALVDCTADPTVVDAYPAFIETDFHVVTPNKKANVLPWRRYERLKDLLQARQKHFLYEANVGAGLPVLSTLHDLVASGDEIVKIEGILSGTLSYLFNTYDGTVSFSQLVREAQQLGYTEPDPREDLSGKDVARKLLILAREIGLKMDIGDVPAQSLVPPRLSHGAFAPAFFDEFARGDGDMLRRVTAARERGSVLRYVAILEDGRARAALEEYPREHPLALTKGSDNIIAFTTKRYARTPLVVQGPGAGADVTAMGVFSDILKLLHYLPE
jgi:aspartokinase/homoserine dehydrogenase 1